MIVFKEIEKPLYWLDDKRFKFYLNKSFLKKQKNKMVVLIVPKDGVRKYTIPVAVKNILKSKDKMEKKFKYETPMELVGYVYELFGEEKQQEIKANPFFWDVNYMNYQL
jgi:hypothetical protein